MSKGFSSGGRRLTGGIFLGIFLLLLSYFFAAGSWAAPAAGPPAAQPLVRDPNINVNLNQILGSPQFSPSIQLLIALAAISLVPFFLISVTSFIRLIIVFSMVRTALGTQQVPPNPVIIGLSFFMTIFIMSPVWEKINNQAVIPYQKGQITQAQAFQTGFEPLREFMFKQTRQQDLALFVNFAKLPKAENLSDIPTVVLIPAFMISELKTSFQIGFVIFLPFLIIDLVVANVLLSLGMFMLSPVMVSLPFKILLFVLVDGWHLITRGLMTSFF